MICLKPTDVECPICGAVNKSLYLDETDGWMECESCGSVVQIRKLIKEKQVPLYHVSGYQILVPLSQK